MVRTRSFFLALLALASLCALVWQSARMQSPLRRITSTTEEGSSINPSMSGDGRIAAFESTEDIAGAGGFESFRAISANVSVDPPTFLQIASTRAPAPAISQDGSRIAFASKDNPLGTNSDANSEIFLYDGARLIQVTNTSPGDIANRVVNGNFLPSISDDGRFVAFSSNRDVINQNPDCNLEIFIFDTVALSFTQLTNSSGTVSFSDAKISGNGAFVAYIRDAGTTTSAKRDLLIQSRDGESPVRLLATDAESLAMTHGRSISDDGARVVWAAETATNSAQVFLFDGRSNITRQITSLGSRATDVPLHATISGDGSRIAFATRRSFLGNSDGSVDLYSFDIPSSTFGRVTSGPSTATAEVVSSLNDDGSVIAFNFPRVLSGVSNSDFANNSEIYVTGTPSRPAFGTLIILNGASFGNEPATTEAVAPDSIAVARGSVLANSTERSQPLANGTFPQTLGGTTVTVNGRRAQIFFVSPTQVNFLMPPDTELGTAEVIVKNSDGFPSRGSVTTLRAAPGVFTFSGDGLGDGVILDANTLQPGPFDPAGGNLRLIIFSTGVRSITPIINASGVSITAGGRALTLASLVPSPTMPGLDEVHVLVPADLRGAGKVDLVIRADGHDSNPATIHFVGDARRDIVINEFLADPPDGAPGDANRDGVRSTSDDEFVELVNTTTHDIDISGYQILTRGSGGTDTVRHVFIQGAPATILPACTAIVVFGGGNPNPGNPAFGGAQILKASTGSLAMINSGGVITLRDQAATIVNFVSYGGSTGLDGDANQSLTRSPDTTGAFFLHQAASGSGGFLFSPGTRINGTAFTPCPPIARVEISPSSATVEAGAQQQFTARAFDAGGNEVSGVIFSWQSSDTSVATIDQNGRATALSAGGAGGAGSTQIRATGRGVQSAPATLTVNPPAPVLTSVTISPVSATARVGEAQQLTAQARDQFGQNIGGVTINFSSNNTAVATVDSVTATSATGSATATVTGRASGSAQITAEANNGSASVASSAAMLTVEPGVGQVLISEFRTRGPNGASDEFIELYNPTLSTVTIGGLKIRASNSAGTVSDRVTIPAGTTLGSGRHYLVANGTANTGYSVSVAANQTYATGIADDGGIAITGSSGTTVIDSVGMSSGSAFKEGTTLAPLTNNVNQSYERKPGGASGNGRDANNNASDFFLNAASSNPQNLDSVGLDLNTADVGLTKTDSPDPVITDSDVTYTITVTNNGPGTAQAVVVTDNLPVSINFVSCSSTDGGTCGGAGNSRTINFSSLASGSSATITLVATANGAGGTTIANAATVTSAASDPVPGNNSATATTNVQAPPSTLTINDVTANEGNGGTTTFVFTVNSSSPAPAGGITFDIATQDSTAIANSDYIGRSLTAQTIPVGQQTYTFDVTVNGDLLVEPNETFFVNLTNASGATIADGQGQGTIQNDDTANLVISHVYAGGGNSGAQFTNDFVEIFNRGTTTINFATTPYSLQYAGATANFGSNKVDLTSGTIAPGKYFLVQLSSGGANGAALPAADASGGINMAATAGKVSLVAGTTSLPVSTCPGDDGAAPFNPNNPTIADFVGYGSSAICYEGPTGPAPAPSATAADFRKAGGCTDTDDNATDFLVAVPSPRNTSAPTNDCSAPPPPTLTINDVSGFEGKGGAATFTFTFRVALSAPAPAGGVSFDIATQDNTATAADGDYVPQTLTSQTIPAGNLAYTFDVTVNGDLKVESNESFFVNVTNISGATVGDSQGLGTIQNDDNPTFTINDVSANETNSGTTTFTFTITSSLPAPAGGITFDIATTDGTAHDDNPATEDNDYVAKSLTAQTITAGNTTYNFQVTVNGDTLVEPNETFFVNITNVLGATIEDGEGQGTIQNDDSANLVISQVYAGGGNSGAQFTNDFVEIFNRGTTTVDFAATPYSIQYAGATANFGSNKANLTSGTIAPGKYFLVQLSSGGAIGAALPAADASGSINMAATAGKVSLVVGTASLPVSTCSGDDGAAPFNPNNPNLADFVGYGSSAICYEGPTGPAPAPSAANADFRKAGGCTDTNDNAADFFVHAPGPRNTRSPLNNCTPGTPPNLSINDVTAAEGNNGSTIFTFTVGLSAPAPSTDVTFDIATQNNTATTANNDYVARSLTSQIIPAGQHTYTFAVTVNGDTAIEPDETFLVSVTNVSGATVTDSLGVGSIQNDDLPTLSINDVSLSEGNVGTRLFTFAVSLSAPAPAAVTFDIATQDNTATVANNDFVARSLTGQTIAARSQNYNFEVTVNGDFNIESDETFFVNVTNVSGATVGDAKGLGTIQNDDTPALSINDVAVNEGDSGTNTASFTVTSSLPAPAGGITFNIATQDNAATASSGDYVSKSLTNQTIPAGQTTYTFNVTVNGDTLVEPNETFLVKITPVSGATVADDTGQGTIQNDDTPVVVISQLYGGGGNSGAVFKNDFIEVFNRGNTTVNLAGWSVQYSSATGSSWSVTPLCSTSACLLLPGRYFLVQEDQGSGGTTNLPPPDASGTIVMTAGAGKVAVVSSTTALTGTCPSSPNILDLVGYGGTASCFEGSAAAPAPSNTLADVRKGGGCVDTNDNAPDFFTHAASPRNIAYQINNCSGQTTDLTINDVTVTEGDAGAVTANFTVTLHGSTGSTVTVDYSTADGTAAAPADYQAIPNTLLVFTPGQLTKTITVNVNGDTLDERGETFFVNLSNATNAAILDNQGQGTITDNDVPPTLTINDVSQNEGNGPTTFTFTVHLSAPALTGGVTFDIATADGTAQDDTPASEDNDYVGQALTGVNIPAGSQDYTFNVTVNGDMVNEPNETFFVNVATVSGATVGDGQGLGTIQNDDSPTLSINDVTVTEGDSGTRAAGFTVTLMPSSNQVVTVNYATANNTAITPGDYQTTSGMLTFNPGETSKPINVLVNGDTINEAICETFFVNLSIPTGGATISDPQGQGSITDNDGTKLVISQIYGGGGNASATFTNDFIEIFNRGNTAVSLNGMSVQYSAATSTTGNYLVTPLPNVMLQPGQYFLVQEASGGATRSPLTPDATGTIVMAASAGKIALVNGTSALAAAGCPSGASIIDFVGYGTTANCREGASTADNSPGPSNNTTSAQRKLAGCQDVGNNRQDFVTAAVSPRNTGTALSLCSCSTSYSSMFMIPGLDSWKDVLAFLNEDAYPPPRTVPVTRSDLISTVALAR